MSWKIATALSIACLCASANANVMLIDAGPLSTGNPLNSPYHSVQPSFTDATWNIQGQSNDSTLFWSDGSSATGATLTTFKGNAGSTSLAPAGWSSNSSTINGSLVNTGVYAGNSAAADGWMMTTTFSNARPIGIQIAGLPAGTYDIYLTGRNTNYISAQYTQNFFASSTSTAGSFDFASYTSQSTTFAASATDKVNAWVFTPGDSSASNYVKLTVTLDAASPYLNIATVGTATNGIFNSIEIAPVPEPASLAIIACSALLLLRSRKRH